MLPNDSSTVTSCLYLILTRSSASSSQIRLVSTWVEAMSSWTLSPAPRDIAVRRRLDLPPKPLAIPTPSLVAQDTNLHLLNQVGTMFTKTRSLERQDTLAVLRATARRHHQSPRSFLLYVLPSRSYLGADGSDPIGILQTS